MRTMGSSVRRTAHVCDGVLCELESERLIDARCVVVRRGAHDEAAAGPFAYRTAACFVDERAADALAAVGSVGGDRLEAAELAYVEEAELGDDPTFRECAQEVA